MGCLPLDADKMVNFTQTFKANKSNFKIAMPIDNFNTHDFIGLGMNSAQQ